MVELYFAVNGIPSRPFPDGWALGAVLPPACRPRAPVDDGVAAVLQGAPPGLWILQELAAAASEIGRNVSLLPRNISLRGGGRFVRAGPFKNFPED